MRKMSELINIWREIGSYNRFAETKLVFFIGLTVAILSIENTALGSSSGPIAILRGGDTLIVNVAASVSLLMAAFALIPQLQSIACTDRLVPKHKSENVFYFMSIANFPSGADWLRTYGISIPSGETQRANMLAEQIYILAKITARKFSVLRFALIMLITGWTISWLYAYLILATK